MSKNVLNDIETIPCSWVMGVKHKVKGIEKRGLREADNLRTDCRRSSNNLFSPGSQPMIGPSYTYLQVLGSLPQT